LAQGRFAEGSGPHCAAGNALSTRRTTVMPEVVPSTASKAKPKPIATSTPSFEMPKFEMPKFEIPKMEVPAAFREFAEKGLAQAKDNYEKIKRVAEEATDTLEDTYSTATKGCSGYGLKLIESARANSNAAFDLVAELMSAKSYSEVVELSTAYLRSQFDTVSAQAKDLAECAQKVATDTAAPIKESFTSTMSKAA
jgi:phasin